MIQESDVINITGTHLSGSANANVKCLKAASSAVMNYIPKKIFEDFTNLEYLILEKVQLKVSDKDHSSIAAN